MAKKAKAAEAKAPARNTTTMSNGTVVESKVVTGKRHRLTAREQGQLARGEIDENLEPTDKAAKDRNAVRVIKTSETLYQGPITASATASATGEKVSFKWDQAMPTTHKGLFNSFLAAHPSADYDTFEVDTDNKIDPTLRTSLEK